MLDRSRDVGPAIIASGGHDALDHKLRVLVDGSLPAVLAEDLAGSHPLNTSPWCVADAVRILERFPGNEDCPGIKYDAHVTLMLARIGSQVSSPSSSQAARRPSVASPLPV